MLLLPLVTVLIAVLWYWRPWHRPIVIREGNNPRDGAAMVWVPAGTFRMGTDHLRVAVRNRDWKEARHALRRRLKGQEGSNEAPSRIVYLDGYWIYKYEVTVKQYRAYCRATNRQMPEMPWWGWRDNDPIVNVSWHDATKYAVWAGASLPTEAQWEKAARGPNGWVYPWGNFWDGTKCSNSVDAGAGAPPSPIGSFPTGVSPYGAHDMAGNVEEWCLDFFDWYYYKHAPRQNPVGPATGSSRVLRGGFSGGNDPSFFRAAKRDLYNSSDSSIGFRCVVNTPSHP